MKSIIVLCVLVALSGALAEETYTSENDDFDVEALVKDPQNLLSYVHCFIDKASCDSVAGDFKKDLPEAVQQACAKCTPAQKHILKKFLDAIKVNTPSGTFEEFKQKFDPEDKYFAALETTIAKS